MQNSKSEWLKRKSLFQAALNLAPEERLSYLDSAEDSEETRAAVKLLLMQHDLSDGFLRSPLEQSPLRIEEKIPPSSASIRDPHIMQCPGGFCIERLMGQGGMGTVYAARQSHPDRQVAVKILKQGSRNELRSQRFEHEIAILARLDHPGIAKIFAAGVHDFGSGNQPWFAMELIQGATLSEHLRCVKQTTQEKLRVLIQLCDAVQHAHEHGVIHRDLKPSNIIMSTEKEDHLKSNESLRPRVVDFGIARLLDQDESVPALTHEGELLGTWHYMSVEQLTAVPLDTRTDIFSLGMIGFEMIAGQLAYNRNGCSLIEIVRQASTDMPLRLRQLDSRFDRDLESIFAMALHPDRHRRYLSAEQFKADIARYLAGERVLARAPSWIYTSRKFVSRHRALVAATLAAFVALSIGLVLYARGEYRARQEAARYQFEAEKSQAINDFITNDFMMKLIAAASELGTPNSLNLRDLVQKAATNVDSMFGERPAIEAAIRNELGTIYYNLGAFEEGALEYQIALNLWQANLGKEHADTLKAVNNLGQTYIGLRNMKLAEPLIRQAWDGRRKALGEDDPATLRSMNNLAEICRQTDRADEAESLFRTLIERQQARGLDDDKTTLAALTNYGFLLIQQDRIDEALPLHLKVYKAGCRTYGADHPLTLNLGMRAAQTLLLAEKTLEAEQLVVSILNQFEITNGPDHGSTISARRLLARIYRKNKEKTKGLEQLRLAVDALEKSGRDPELLKKVRAEMASR